MDSSTTSQMSMPIQNMSESLYVGMCHEIGTPQEVASRRDIMDMMEFFRNKVTERTKLELMISGSRREGFRIPTSDIDTMLWPTHHRVIWDFSQSEVYNIHRQALILSDSSESPPEFNLLWLPLETGWQTVLSSCLRINGRFYISSSKHRENTNTLISSDSTIHGPCSSGTSGSVKYDLAHCVVSDFWPPSASSWKERCHSWPSCHVANDIVRNGCHFVAIGHKLGIHVDNEWRISFSQAECKLVYSMNHTQFLTYGLLKLFLKEIINEGLRDEDQLLCSYHMKTAIFWVIQQNMLPHWCPQNLLVGFWVCFKLLLKWVYEGVCPNFFIPQNNMFLSNIFGYAQKTLFLQLYGLYEKGIALLLHSPSIRSSIIDVLSSPRLTVCTDEHTLISEAEFDVELFDEINRNDSLHTTNQQDCMKYLQTVEQLLYHPLTQYQVVTFQKNTATFLQCTAFTLHSQHTNIGCNKQVYVVDKMSSNMLKIAAKFGCITDLLYIAMHYYMTFRYKEALSVIEMTKVKLAQPYLKHYDHVDRGRYTEAVGGLSWSTKMRQAVAWVIKVKNEIYCINELIPEQQSSRENSWPMLYIPPFVLLHMLEFLCSCHVDTMRAQSLNDQALDNLQTLVHHDQGQLVPEYLRDISWEILGICQQMKGSPHAALKSYQQSLNEYPYNKIQTATTQRIHELHLRISNYQ